MTLRFIDKYEIVTTLGRGSMGVVYKAKDPEIGRLVAIKTLKSVFMGDDAAGNEALQRFRQESRSAGKLHHPNIVTIFEAGRTENGSPYIVMEYIEGKSLETMLAESGPLDVLAALHYLAQIASAIDYAHSQSVIHRDIKPSNIIVDARHRPYLLDFGVAKLSDTSLTPAGTVVGTPSYMSPEQIRGSQLDGRTDLFSFAVVAFEVFTGSRPFPGSDFTTVVSNIIHKEPLTFTDFGCALPPELETVLRHALAKEREDRYQSALEFIDAAAQVFGVILDGTGLAGGYTPGLKLPDPSARDAASRLRADTVVGAFFPGPVGGEGAPAADLDKTVADIPNPLLQQPPATSERKSTYANGSDRASEQVTGAVAAPDAGATSLFSEPKSAATPASGRNGVPWITTLIGLSVVALLVLGGLSASPKLQQSLRGMLGFDDEGTDDDRPAMPSPTPPPAPEQTPVVESRPTPAPVEPVAKWKRPSIPAEGFTDSGVAALSDAELGWLLSTENSDVVSYRMAIAEAGRRQAEDFTAFLVEATKNHDFKVRVDALKALSRAPHYKREIAIDAILNLLNDNEFIVRGFAAKILASVGGPKATAALEARTKEEKNAVVLKVLNDTLGQLKRNPSGAGSS
ncbi:MAG: protein kinase [Bdellovibrionota bacterium]